MAFRTITTKYEATCRRCGVVEPIGTRMRYAKTADGKGSVMYHIKKYCKAVDQAERDAMPDYQKLWEDEQAQAEAPTQAYTQEYNPGVPSRESPSPQPSKESPSSSPRAKRKATRAKTARTPSGATPKAKSSSPQVAS